MKANVTNTTTKTTGTTPVVPESTVTAADAAAMLDKTEDIMAMAKEAVKNNMTEADFIRYVSMSFFNYASDLEALKHIQNDAAGAFKNAVNEKKLDEDMATYQQLTSTDRLLVQVTESMVNYGDSSMASLIQELLLEKASKVKVSFEIGKIANNKTMVNDLKYIINSLKLEPATSGSWTNKLIEIYDEIFTK